MDLHGPTVVLSLLVIALFVGFLVLGNWLLKADDRKERRRRLQLLNDYHDGPSAAKKAFARDQLVGESFMVASMYLKHAEFMWFIYAQDKAEAEVKALQLSARAA
jgi:hypothetical protein